MTARWQAGLDEVRLLHSERRDHIAAITAGAAKGDRLAQAQEPMIPVKKHRQNALADAGRILAWAVKHRDKILAAFGDPLE